MRSMRRETITQYIRIKERKRNRLKDYDYSRNGYYFITICSKNGKELLGMIRDHGMVLDELGVITDTCWRNMPHRFPDVTVDEYIIMPNHLHGIVVIGTNAAGNTSVMSKEGADPCSPQDRTKMYLSKIVHSFKSSVTREVRRQFNIRFEWQKSFYDHVIRDDASLDKIREYISNNPLKWETDRDHRDGIERTNSFFIAG
jgi:putative transposase